MRSTFTFFALLAIVATGTTLRAHHSYGGYFRDQSVSVEGDVERVLYQNPHTVFTIRTKDLEIYTAEWLALRQLRGWGLVGGELKPGDHIIIAGSPWRDPAEHRLSLLTDIRRPADGWHWSRTVTPPREVNAERR